MKLKTILLAACSLFCSLSAFSQTTNYALRFNGDGKVDCGSIPEIDGSALYSVQFLMNPSEWIQNSYIFKRGSGADEFSLRLGTQGELLFKNGAIEKKIASDVSVDAWTQITVSAFNNGIDVWVAGNKTWYPEVTGAVVPASAASLVLGENFKGRIDEFRIWNTEMPSAEEDNLAFRNTVNKFHPKYDDLILYYKFDQNLCEDIVDYKYNHHGKPVNAVREAVTDNEYFKYRVVSGYSSFVRHCDRLQIDRDMHLLTNDLIFLDAQVNGYTGEVTMTYPDNQGVLTNAELLTEYEGRSGVIRFKGGNTGMNVGKEVLRTSTGLPSFNTGTIEMWLNINNWVENSYIFNKSDETHQFAVRLGKEADKALLVEVNGYVYTFNNALKNDGWEHIAVVIASTTGRANVRIRLVTGEGSSTVYASDIVIPEVDDFTILDTQAEAVIGESFDGCIDECMVWGMVRTADKVALDAKGETSDLIFPGGGDGAIYLLSYWKFDNAENPGLDTRSWKNMLNEIRELYKDYRGYKIRLGLISSEAENGNKVWPNNISRSEWRQNLVNGIKELLPYCDGIDIDFEWLYSGDSRWDTGYGPMVEEVRAAVPSDKVFSVSLHPVAYYLPKKYLDMPDYYTMQIYGPQKTYFLYDNYVNAYNSFIAWGYPKEKIGMSFPTTATTGSNVSGYKNIVAANPDLSEDANTAMMNGVEYTFNGVTCVKDKMKFILEKNSGTVMYFDMGNDQAVSDPLSLIRAANSIISSNVDIVVTDINDIPGSVQQPSQVEKKTINLFLDYSASQLKVKSLSCGDLNELKVYTSSGMLVLTAKLSGVEQYVSVGALPAGVYVVTVKAGTDYETFKICKK